MSTYWSDEEFIQIVSNSNTISEVLKHFQCPTNQGHYNRAFHKSVKNLNIDISHLISGAKIAKGFNKIPTSELLVKGKFRHTVSLKDRLIKENLLINNCYECQNPPIWRNKPLKLQLDHINGDNTDNRLENLRLLCPNCHSQTETYCGSKKKKEKHAYKFVCKICGGSKKHSKSQMCISCKNQNTTTKIKWPTPETVLQMVKDSNFVQVGKQLNVSDNAVRKFLKNKNLL